MHCYTCERQHLILLCGSCYESKFQEDFSKTAEANRALEKSKERISSLIKPSLKFRMDYEILRQKVEEKEKKIRENREILFQYQYRIDQASLRIDKYKTLLASAIPRTKESSVVKLEKARKERLKMAAWVLRYNPYFPDFSISELFKLEKCISYSQIVMNEGTTKSIDKPSYIVTFKTQLSLLMTDEHRQALLHSLNVLCQFLILAKGILSLDLPCTLENHFSYYSIADFSGNQYHLRVDDITALENGLIFLYMNFRYIQQQAGVDLAAVNGLFDVDAIVNSPFLGKWTSIPSLPIEPKPAKEEEEEDWEFI